MIYDVLYALYAYIVTFNTVHTNTLIWLNPLLKKIGMVYITTE